VCRWRRTGCGQKSPFADASTWTFKGPFNSESGH
jgi:hypothetical protein